jgi:hypothetical protein
VKTAHKVLWLFDLAFRAKENKEMDHFIRSKCGRLIGLTKFRTQIQRHLGRTIFASAILFILTLALVAPAIASGPFRSHQRWYQIGKASWYGGQFQGRKTATGEAYDMNQLTCAHRTLPLGTWLKVTNLHNKKVVYVRVSDRGPVPQDRIVDLSYAAAQAVGISGLGEVRLDKASMEDPEVAKAMLDQVRMPPLVPNGMFPVLK